MTTPISGSSRPVQVPSSAAPVSGAGATAGVNPALDPSLSSGGPGVAADGFTAADPTTAGSARTGLGTKQQQVDDLLKSLSAIQPGTPRWDELKKFAGNASPEQIQAEIAKYKAKAQDLLVHSSQISPSEFQSLLGTFDTKFKASLALQGALYDTQDTKNPDSKQSKALAMWCDDPVECGVAADTYRAQLQDLQRQLDSGKISPDEMKTKLSQATDNFHTDLMIRKNSGMKAFQTRLKKEMDDMNFAGPDDTSF